MLSWIREKFGKVIIGSIIAFIAFVFVFYGVFSPKATRGLHEGAVAGTVNDDAITISDFNRELNRRIEFFKNIAGGKITDEQLKTFRIRESVFQELANRKLMIQEAWKIGIVASDEEVKEKIKEIPAFQKDGKFDVQTYKQVLEANQHSPGSFERLVREDASLQQWEGFFRERIRVSEDEIHREFLISQDKRNIKFVLLTPESAKKSIQVDAAEVQKFLADPGKQNLAKLKFDEGKNTAYKGQSFDQAKETIARSILAGERLDDIQKINQKVADQVLALMTSEKASDAKVDSFLKAQKVDQTSVKSTGLLTRGSTFVPGIGEAKELIADAFAAKSPINPALGGKAKKYQLADRILIAVVTETKQPDLAQLPAQRETLLRQAMGKKVRDVYQDWMKKLTAKAKIDMNPAVVGSD